MNYLLDTKEGREALALELRIEANPERASTIRYGKETWLRAQRADARRAITDPALLAGLIVEAANRLNAKAWQERWPMRASGDIVVVWDIRDAFIEVSEDMVRARAALSRLLALPDGATKEDAIRALEGAEEQL